MNNDITRILQLLGAPGVPPTQHQQLQTPDPRLQQQQQQLSYSAAPAIPTPPPPAPAISPRPDPRTIKDYPAAVRYITKTLSRDAEAMEKIKRMKGRQHEHERLWWQGREDLLKLHATRAENQKRVEAVLSKLGTMSADADKSLPTEAEDLAAYDAKVHRRCDEMVMHMSVELGQLGVPLFCGGAYEGAVPEEELRSMRARIVELLEDICED